MSADPAQQRLHQENVDLKKVLKESVPGTNRRAEAAERNFFEIRKNLVSSAIEAVLVQFTNAGSIRTSNPTSACSLI